MKRTILLSALFTLLVFNGFSQQDSLLKDKKGNIVLPQKGDFALGIGVNSIFNYVGNLFSSSGDNRLALTLLNNNQLYGKYFLASNRAVRVRLGISKYALNYHDNITSDFRGNLDADSRKESYMNLSFVLGLEERKGRDRLQLAYGAEFKLYFSNSKFNYSYGSYSDTIRPLEVKNSNGIGIGARAFVGTEYFLLPKVSIGGEVGLGIMGNMFGKSYEKYSAYNDITFDNNTLEINTDILNGQIYLLFHFN